MTVQNWTNCPDYWSVGLSVCLWVYLPVCGSVCLSVIYLPVCGSVCLLVYLPVCRSICLSVCLSIYLVILWNSNIVKSHTQFRHLTWEQLQGLDIFQVSRNYFGLCPGMQIFTHFDEGLTQLSHFYFFEGATFRETQKPQRHKLTHIWSP